MEKEKCLLGMSFCDDTCDIGLNQFINIKKYNWGINDYGIIIIIIIIILQTKINLRDGIPMWHTT